jgi:hypothetical protein
MKDLKLNESELILDLISSKLEEIESKQKQILKDFKEFFGYNQNLDDEMYMYWLIASYFCSVDCKNEKLSNDTAYSLIKKYVELSKEKHKFESLLSSIKK